MYVLYQHHKDAHGKIVLTEMKLTSGLHSWRINFNAAAESAAFAYLTGKQGILKSPPTLQRAYDNDKKVWSYMEGWGEKLLTQLQIPAVKVLGIQLKEVTDLEYLLTQTPGTPEKQKPQIRPEDFFYQQAPAVASNILSSEQIQEKLAVLLEVPKDILAVSENGELKKLYRKAAMRLHPDRNNGDGSRMSELNMLWGMYHA